MKSIKGLTLALCLLAAGLFTSCAKNEDLIIGQWECLSATGVTSDLIEQEGAKYEFKANGKVTLLIVGQKVEVKYKVSGNTLTIGEGKEAIESNIDLLNKKSMKISRSGKNAAVIDYERI